MGRLLYKANKDLLMRMFIVTNLNIIFNVFFLVGYINQQLNEFHFILMVILNIISLYVLYWAFIIIGDEEVEQEGEE